ncbi:MAG TPA: agmatine deiminase family protein [Steroidobacteraceae bacterium]|nr:agmatine deiminase family protein [Steroidobacteraceae bacterium]
MPAEWATHARCWMAWPKRIELWREHIEGARADYVRVAQAIAAHEPLTMIADPADAAEARQRCGSSIQIMPMPIDDSWLRDSAPTFIVNPAGGRAAAAFTFNAWGNKYHPHDRDATLGPRMAELAGLPVYRSELVVEGGGFLCDGEGTLITAETCVLNANRNPGWSKAEADAELRAMLGVEKVIWLPGDVMDTETDGHVDGYLAYVKPATVLLEVVADPADPRFAIMAENRRVLEAETDARGRRFNLQPIAEAPRSAVAEGSCRSYVNFYLANGAVIAPAYGIAEDEAVAQTLRLAYPDRRIVRVALKDLFRGGGGIHCITQQEPAASPHA